MNWGDCGTELKCPYCGRKFVLHYLRLFSSHVQACADKRQHELDEEWRAQTEEPKP